MGPQQARGEGGQGREALNEGSAARQESQCSHFSRNVKYEQSDPLF